MSKTSTIKIEVPAGYLLTSMVRKHGYQCDPTAMPNNALLYVLEYGFQKAINDRTGGKSDDEAAAIATAWRDRMLSGDLSRTTSGPSTKWLDKALQVWLTAPANAGHAAAKAYAACADAESRASFRADKITSMNDATRAFFTEHGEKLRLEHEAEQRRKAEALAASQATLAAADVEVDL